jgi:hypothetical protein|tara:strand:- start:119 stop:334 length:216 start_codon:yes stop_codon:yes gene_type:complete
MSKKIDLNDLFQLQEEVPLIINIEDMDFEERNTLFDRLYQDYIFMKDEKDSKTVSAKYRKLLKEISKMYFH